jgi:signal transduction histidine kinase
VPPDRPAGPPGGATAADPPARPTTPPRPAWDPHPHETPPPWLRPTIRIRLTVLYGGMFLIAGVVLLWIIYLLAAQAINQGSALPFRVTSAPLTIVPNNCLASSKSSDLGSAIATCMQHQRDIALNTLLKRSLLALIGLAVVAFAFGYVMAGRVLAPLGRITRTARGVVSSDLKRRIELDGPDDELKELADTFDGMLDRLERSFDAQRRFVANASHELRTPLAINRTLLEVQLADPEVSPDLQQLGRTLLATNERSEQLVEGLLLLARSENEIVDRKPVDLAEAASRALEQTRAEAGERHVELREALAPAVVQGNGVLLERIALNLVQNAVRYNEPENGWVAVTTSAEPGHALLVVENTGPVVPAYEVDTMFEPFRRLRSQRTGSDKGVGLGLSIARSVARAHGGVITAEPREGGGLVMRVAIPL